jgi:Flp pilus assembly protein TadG
LVSRAAAGSVAGEQAGSASSGVAGSDAGSAVVEFSLVSVLLMMLLLAVLQVAVYLYVRNIAAASAAEGARYAANANVSADAGAARAGELIARGAGERTATDLRCVGQEEDGPGGVRVSAVRCSGALPVFFAPLGRVLPLTVSAHSVEEQPAAGQGGAAGAPGARR